MFRSRILVHKAEERNTAGRINYLKSILNAFTNCLLLGQATICRQ